MRNLNLMGSGMPDYGFARCDRHHETVDFRLRKIGAPPKDQQSKRLRCAAIVFNYRHYVAAYPPGRVHRAVSPIKTEKLPSGSDWLHEIKHDGFRIIARKSSGWSY